MQEKAGQFRSAAFGGFHRQDVLHYIEQLTREHQANCERLERELTEERTARQQAEERLRQALAGRLWGAAAERVGDLEATAGKLVNGFCVLLFPGAGAAAFEVKTSVKRGPSPPEVENTVKGAKDAFTETLRMNTSLLRRHLRTPALRLRTVRVGRRSLTAVTVCSGLNLPSAKPEITPFLAAMLI